MSLLAAVAKTELKRELAVPAGQRSDDQFWTLANTEEDSMRLVLTEPLFRERAKMGLRTCCGRLKGLAAGSAARAE
jgi:hypothetical protein